MSDREFWKHSEDQLLLKMRQGPPRRRWDKIALVLDRSAQSCRARYRRLLAEPTSGSREKYWTNAADVTLQTLHDAGLPPNKIAVRMQRLAKSVETRLKYLERQNAREGAPAPKAAHRYSKVDPVTSWSLAMRRIADAQSGQRLPAPPLPRGG